MEVLQKWAHHSQACQDQVLVSTSIGPELSVKWYMKASLGGSCAGGKQRVWGVHGGHKQRQDFPVREMRPQWGGHMRSQGSETQILDTSSQCPGKPSETVREEGIDIFRG